MRAIRRQQCGSLLLELLLASGIVAVLSATFVSLYAFYGRALAGEALSSEVSRFIEAVNGVDFSERAVGDDVTGVVIMLVSGMPEISGEIASIEARLEADGALKRVRVAVDGSGSLCAAMARGALRYDVGLRAGPLGQPLDDVQFSDGRMPSSTAATACGQEGSRMELLI